MRLMIAKVGSGYRWVLDRSGACIEDAGSLDCAGSFVANDPASLGMEDFGSSSSFGMTGEKERGPYTTTIPGMEAAGDREEKWWERMRGNPKRLGEISQAAFLLKASTMGFNLAQPWGDSERWDFVVWGSDQQRVMRVQVKGTGRLHRGGYDIQPVHSTRRGGKKRYTKRDIDVIAAHVQPVDAWYLIPIEKVGRVKSLRLYPGGRCGESQPLNAAMGRGRRISSRQPGCNWEQWLEAWEVIGIP